MTIDPAPVPKNAEAPDEFSPGLRRILERKNLFLEFGYDLDQERDAILDAAAPLSGQILETGTGKGHFSLALARRGISFISVDISREEQVLAGEYLKFHRLERFADLRIQNGERLDFEDGFFDMVFSINALHHFEQPFSVIGELIRVLRPGGRLILSDFTEKGFDIMDRIHALDQHVHDRGKSALPDTEVYLRGENFGIRKSATPCQWTLIAEKPR